MKTIENIIKLIIYILLIIALITISFNINSLQLEIKKIQAPLKNISRSLININKIADEALIGSGMKLAEKRREMKTLIIVDHRVIEYSDVEKQIQKLNLSISEVLIYEQRYLIAHGQTYANNYDVQKKCFSPDIKKYGTEVLANAHCLKNMLHYADVVVCIWNGDNEHIQRVLNFAHKIPKLQMYISVVDKKLED